ECEERGLRTWFVDWTLEPGQDVKSNIAEAIGKSRYCIVLLSAATSPSSAWISHEWSTILKQSWQESDFKILPVRLDSESDFPAFLREWKSLTAADHVDQP